MRTEHIRIWLCAGCLVVTALSTAVTATEVETPSIITRIEREEDPELGDLIRLALERRIVRAPEETLKIIREVTHSYAQITLLDEQIAEVSRKAEAATVAEMRYELLLAKAELEAKRTTEMASLRELMGVMPKLPLDEQATATLKAWVSIQMLGERFFVLDGVGPFDDYWIMQRWQCMGLMSEDQLLAYVRSKLENEENLPIRLHIYYDPEAYAQAYGVRGRLIAVAKQTHSQMKTEIRLERITHVGSGQATFYLREGKVTTFYTHAMRRPDGREGSLVTGPVEISDLEQHILWRLTKPKNVPVTFRIEYDQAGAATAKQIADTADAVIKRLKIADVAKVEQVAVEPVDVSVFMGRWRGETRGDIAEIDVREGGVCEVTMGDRFGKDTTPGAIKAGTTVTGTWQLTTDAIVMDIKDRSEHGADYVYRAYLEKKGILIVDKGVIYPQGSFHVSGEPRQMILKPVK